MHIKPNRWLTYEPKRNKSLIDVIGGRTRQMQHFLIYRIELKISIRE